MARALASETWDFVISSALGDAEFVNDRLLSNNDDCWLFNEFIGDSKDTDDIAAFFWYMLYTYGDIDVDDSDHGTQVNMLLGKISGWVSSSKEHDIGNWEMFINAPLFVEVPEAKKLLVKEWLTKIGMGDHSTKIGL
jgi:hypothetical protein